MGIAGKKIAQIMLSTGMGGAEKSFVSICNGLAQRKVGVLAVVPTKAPYIQQLSTDVDVVRLKASPSRNNPLLMYELLKLFRNQRVSLLHSHSAKASHVARRIGKITGTPMVATKRNSRKGRIFNKVEHVIAVSDAVAKTIESGSATIINNGIDPENYFSAQLEPDQFIIGAFGRLDDVKGFDQLISALPGIDGRCRLKIYGDGAKELPLKTLAEDLGVSKRVQFCGFTDDVSTAMNSCHLIVVSSLTEGFCRVLIEGLYYARVLISTPVGGAAQALTEEFIYGLDNIELKINEVFDNYDQYLRQYERVKQDKKHLFTVDNMIQAHIEYYQSIVT